MLIQTEHRTQKHPKQQTSKQANKPTLPMAAELSDFLAKTSEEISKCYGLLLSADARTSPILERQIKGLEERQALVITTLGNTLHLHPNSLASAPTLPLPPNQGKRQYHANAVPLRRHLGVRRSLPLFAALWGGPRDPCSAVSLVCGRRVYPLFGKNKHAVE